MSRFLFVVPPLAGHVNPTLGVAAELVRRGHRVAWAGTPEIVRPLVGPDAEVYACAAPDRADGQAERAPESRGPAALKFLWEQFLIPLAESMAPGVGQALADFEPDVVVADQQALAGALVADARGVPWATSATTSAELVDPLGGMPKVQAWLRDELAGLGSRLGLPAAVDPRFSPHLVLVFSSELLTGPLDGPADVLKFVGPSFGPRPAEPFPWDWIAGPEPTVLVTLGTVNADAGVRFLAESVRAMASRPRLRAVVVDPTGTAGPAPANVLLRRRIPQLDLLPHVQAVVCHAGHNTVCEALHHGVPLVVAPIRDDQPIVAQQAVAAGAAVRLRFGRAGADQIGAAVDAVLTDPSCRAGARRVQDSFRTAGGAAAAAGHLTDLAAGWRPRPSVADGSVRSRPSSPQGAVR